MKRELSIHFLFLISFLILVSVFRKWVSLAYWPLWAGGIFGTFLPDIDYIIYVFLLDPHNITSQKVNYFLKQKNYLGALDILVLRGDEKRNLIFHSAFFQIIFLVLTFLIITSSGSLFGIGIVLAFSLHLLIDQLIDFTKFGNMDNWTRNLLPNISKNQTTACWGIMVVVFFIFGFFI